MFCFLKFIDIFEDSQSFSHDIIQVILDMEQNIKIYQNLVLFPGYVAFLKIVCFLSPSGFFYFICTLLPQLFLGSLDIHFGLHSSLNMYHTNFLKMFQCPISVSLFILLTVCDLFSNKITDTKSSLFSIQLLGTLYNNVMLVLQRFKYLLYFNSKFSLNLNESSFFSHS